MATLNLGRIKPVFRGAYNGATAYVVDDIVTFGDETFICILASTGNATSNTTYWSKLASKGTDGTDVGTVITTQGDLLYRDGSGLQRLPIGTAGKALKVNSSANGFEYGTAGGVLSAKKVVTRDRSSFASNTPVNASALNMTFTPTASNSILRLEADIHMATISTSVGMYFYDNTNSVRIGVPTTEGSRQLLTARAAVNHSSAWIMPMRASAYYSIGNANATDFRIYIGTHGGNTSYMNRNVSYSNNSDIDSGIVQSSFTITEYANGLFTGSGQNNN